MDAREYSNIHEQRYVSDAFPGHIESNSFLEEIAKLTDLLDKSEKQDVHNEQLDLHAKSIGLFQDEWTTYGRETY
jgi:hypothetical protein